MAYRDDGDALLARVAALDAEAERLREERDAAVAERNAAVAERTPPSRSETRRARPCRSRRRRRSRRLFPGFLVVPMFTIPGKMDRGALDDMPRWTVAPMIAHAVFWIVSLAAWKAAAAHATALVFLAPSVLIAIYRRW